MVGHDGRRDADRRVLRLQCSPPADPGNCGSWLGLFYFISFQVLGGFVFLNLVVAVILAELNPELVSQADIDSFREDGASSTPPPPR